MIISLEIQATKFPINQPMGRKIQLFRVENQPDLNKLMIRTWLSDTIALPFKNKRTNEKTQQTVQRQYATGVRLSIRVARIRAS